MNERSEFYVNAKVQFLSQHFSICTDYIQSPGKPFYWKRRKPVRFPFICLGKVEDFTEVLILLLINS